MGMKKRNRKTKSTPITYQHIGSFLWYLISAAFILFVVISAGAFWTVPAPKIEGAIKSVVCYNLDGTGPVENCPAQIKCYSARGNGANEEIACPLWPANTEN